MFSIGEVAMTVCFGDVRRAEVLVEDLTTMNDEIVSSRASEDNHPPDEAEMTASKSLVVEGLCF